MDYTLLIDLVLILYSFARLPSTAIYNLAYEDTEKAIVLQNTRNRNKTNEHEIDNSTSKELVDRILQLELQGEEIFQLLI
jgi:hypothetical protein